MVQPRRKRVRRNVKGERHIDKGKRASGEKKSPPLPCLEKFPVFRRVFDQVPLDVQFHVNTLWLASLFPAINRFRRKNLRELVRRRNPGQRGLPGKSGAHELLLFSRGTTERRVTSVRIPTRSWSVSNCETDTMTTWTLGWEEGREVGRRRGRKQSGSKVAFAKEKEEAYGHGSFIWGVL